MNKFNSVVAGALDIAHTEALERKSTEVYPIHLLWGLYKNPASFLSRQLKTYEKAIKETLSSLPQAKEAVAMDQLRANAKLSEWLTRASSQAIQSGNGEVSETELAVWFQNHF